MKLKIKYIIFSILILISIFGGILIVKGQKKINNPLPIVEIVK